ncbi:hypothetical protein M153_2350007230 [Pseudoloma neurophilia]|uniref:Uncharacterized protein n=1 Tax=Pseudoloma neurophilia TaxID=146866 RepID=A0A0R0M512_9MICR|nr:hypothetical protein M153_2350004518 [Pseudoloma neurophilia]KRH94511.1 hypothetical protein M153_2350007230 [Pseudoloma neurophilia]
MIANSIGKDKKSSGKKTEKNQKHNKTGYLMGEYTFYPRYDSITSEMQEYEKIRNDVYHKIRTKLSDLDKEINEIYEKGGTDAQLEEIRKRRRRSGDKIFIRKVSAAEAEEDFNEIRGVKNTLFVTVSNGILKIDSLEVKRRDNVKVDMHGENFKGTVISVTPKSISIKTKNGKKYNILIRSIKQENVKIIKPQK